MKKIISMLMAVVMLLCLVPVQLMAEDANEAVVLDNGGADGLELGDEIVPEGVGEGAITIKRIGQWTNDCTKKSNEDKTYNSLDDHIGMPPVSGGLLRKFAKVFIGWSDMAPVLKEREIEGEKVTCQSLADGATLFSPEDTVKTYQDYVKNVKAKKGSEYTGDENTIYAVYYEINGFNEPLDSDAFNAIGQVLGNIEALKASANDNTLKVCEKDDAKSIVKTEIKEDNRNKGTNKADIIGKYKGEDIELGLESEFIMDDSMAMLAYRNEAGTNALRPILSYDYNTRYKNKDFPTEGEKQNYTYVDLNMDFGEDEGLVIPDEMFLEFKSYSWRPLYAFGIKPDGKKDVLNNLDDYKDLVSGSNPKTTFSVNTKYKTVDDKDKNYRKITIRVVLREWDNSVAKPHQNPFSGERIPEKIIPKGSEGTIASEILTNMTLRVLGSKDGKDFVKITKEKAKELADSNAIKKIEIKGTVAGQVYLNVSGFGVPVPINTVNSNDFSISLVKGAPAPKPTEPSTVILTLDENHRSGKITNIEVEVGDLIEPHLYIPRRRGYIFRGWSYDRDHLDEVKPGDRIYSDTTLYAIWKRAEEERVEEPEEIKGDDHKAYIFGYPNGTVRPNGSITRAEAAAMLARLLNIEAIGSAAKPQFTDTESSWYNKAINAVVFRGIMKGYPDGRFRPNAPITRAEFTQMISTIDNKPYGVAPFADVTGHWAERAIGSEYQAKRITGYPDGLFRPDANITRAEAAVILNKIFERKYDNLSLLKCKNPQTIKRFTDLDESFWGWNDMVEATNTHEYVRREKNKLPEDWLLIK